MVKKPMVKNSEYCQIIYWQTYGGFGEIHRHDYSYSIKRENKQVVNHKKETVVLF